jgi:hypothetical protein
MQACYWHAGGMTRLRAPHGEFATLTHETTHVLLHFDRTAGTRPDLTTRETEAEAVTYLLCAQLGIAGTDASLERIRATAQRFTAELYAIRFDVDSDDPQGAPPHRSRA